MRKHNFYNKKKSNLRRDNYNSNYNYYPFFCHNNRNKRTAFTDYSSDYNNSDNNGFYSDHYYSDFSGQIYTNTSFNKKSNQSKNINDIDNNKNWILKSEKDKDIYERNKLYLEFNLDSMAKEDYLLEDLNIKKCGDKYEECSIKFINKILKDKCIRNNKNSIISFQENEIKETLTINPDGYLVKLNKDDLKNILDKKHIFFGKNIEINNLTDEINGIVEISLSIKRKFDQYQNYIDFIKIFNYNIDIKDGSKKLLEINNGYLPNLSTKNKLILMIILNNDYSDFINTKELFLKENAEFPKNSIGSILRMLYYCEIPIIIGYLPKLYLNETFLNFVKFRKISRNLIKNYEKKKKKKKEITKDCENNIINIKEIENDEETKEKKEITKDFENNIINIKENEERNEEDSLSYLFDLPKALENDYLIKRMNYIKDMFSKQINKQKELEEKITIEKGKVNQKDKQNKANEEKIKNLEQKIMEQNKAKEEKIKNLEQKIMEQNKANEEKINEIENQKLKKEIQLETKIYELKMKLEDKTNKLKKLSENNKIINSKRFKSDEEQK